MAGNYTHTTRTIGTVLTAAIYNGDHQKHIDSRVPANVDDYSSTISQYQLIEDPGEVGSESLAVNLAGELTRLRFAIKDVKAFIAQATPAQWYSDITLPDANPVGMVVMYAAGGALPAGYLECDGSAISRTTYAGLFAVAGTTFGAGDGSTTFNLPDYRGRYLIDGGAPGGGLSTRTVGTTGGSETATVSSAQMASHNHQISGSHSHTAGMAAELSPHSHAIQGTLASGGADNALQLSTANNLGTAIQLTTDAGGSHTHSLTAIATVASGATIDSAGSGAGHTNVQPALPMRFLVKV